MDTTNNEPWTRAMNAALTYRNHDPEAMDEQDAWANLMHAIGALRDVAQATQAVSEPVATQPAEAVAWRSVVTDGLPPCDGDTVYLGENKNGYLCTFNWVNPDGCCLQGLGDALTAQFSGLEWWTEAPTRIPYCKTCRGSGEVPYEVLHGPHTVDAGMRNCDDCGGTGVIAHPAPASASEPDPACKSGGKCLLRGRASAEFVAAHERASASVAGAGEALNWMPFALTVESALNRGDDASMLFDENSPIRDELRRLIEAGRRVSHEDWCVHCGCGHDAAGYAHAPLCQRKTLAARPVADGEAPKEWRRLRAAVEAMKVIGTSVDQDEVIELIDKYAALARQAPAPLSQAVPDEPEYWQWRRKGTPRSLDKTFNSEPAVTTDDSEKRALYTHPQPQAVTEDARDGERKGGDRG